VAVIARILSIETLARTLDALGRRSSVQWRSSWIEESVPRMPDTGAPTAVFARCARRLAARVEVLEARLRDGDDTAWSEYVEAVKVFVLAVSNLTSERQGAYLTTAQMAARLNLSAKTLLKHKASGKIRPAVQHGKLIRWKGNEELRSELGMNGHRTNRGREA
jgi:hypothetical protein